jgi:hypothetical protein
MPENTENQISKYPEGFVDGVKAEAIRLMDSGYTDDQAQQFVNTVFQKYNESKALSDKDFVDAPEWFKESGKPLKDETKKRGFFGQVARTFQNLQITPTGGGGISLFNPLKTESKEEKDVISQDMVLRTDELAKTLLDGSGYRDVSKNVKEHVKDTREKLNAEFNKKQQRTQKVNLDILMEEAYSEDIESDLERVITDISKEKGVTKRDFLLLDPQAIMDEKERFIKMGYTGRMVDRAFDKVWYDSKREHFAEDFEKALIKRVGKDKYEQNRTYFQEQVSESASNRGEKLFNRAELERIQANMRLEELREQEADQVDIEKAEKEIAALDEQLGYDVAPKEQRRTFRSILLDVKDTKEKKIGGNVLYRMYDKEGRKIMRGDEPKEEMDV